MRSLRLQWTILYLLNLVLCFLSGKDYNWDLLNYHYYGPKLMLDGRWTQDYFAASIQSYLNPIAYVPFYLMVEWGWNSIVIGLTLSTIHFMNIIAVGSIARKALDGVRSGREQLIFLACMLAMASPLYLQANGSSFNDPICSVLVLVGARVLLEKELATGRLFLAAGVCLGAAAGVKLTSALFGISFAIVIGASSMIDRTVTVKGVASRLTAYVAGGLVGFLVVHGYWSFMLLRDFGSPTFPFFNEVFGSSEFDRSNIRDLRFLGGGILGLVQLPLDMLRVQSWVYTEAASPDVRFIALVAMAASGLCAAFWLLLKRHPYISFDAACSIFRLNQERRTICLLVALFLVSFVIWGITSRIGRYAFPLWLLLGPLLATCAVKLGGIRFARTSLLLIFCVQAYLNYFQGTDRWAPVAWGREWFDIQLPKELTEQPAGIISTDTMSFSAIVPALHPGSGMATIMGMYTMPNGENTPRRLSELIKRHRGNLYVMYALGQFAPSTKVDVSESRLRTLSEKLLPYGLEVMKSPCLFGRLPFNRRPGNFSAKTGEAQEYVLAFCAIRPVPEGVRKKAADLSKTYDSVFNLFEDRCPDAFSPQRVVTIHHSNEFVRSYFNTASGLYTDHGGLYMTGYRVLFPQYLGQLADLLGQGNSGSFSCPSLPAHRYLKN